MFGMGKAKGLVGLDLGSSAVKAVELKKRGDSYEHRLCSLSSGQALLPRGTMIRLRALHLHPTVQERFLELPPVT